MGVRLEKSPQIPEQGGSPENSGTDYTAMYKEAHPGAVEDVKKAEFMASAMDRSETERKAYSSAALVEAVTDRPDHEIQESLAGAVEARQHADLVAEKVSKVYDRIQDLKS